MEQLLLMNKNLEEKYLSVIEDNVNVGSSNAILEFVILLAGIAFICFILYIFADILGSFFIDRMPDETQMKIENAFSFGIKPRVSVKNNDIVKLENIRDKIIPLDKNLQRKSSFPIYEIPEKEINAFVAPNGTIFFTKGILDEVKDEEVLAFVLAHELGHYAHRDHLKGLSRQIIISVLLSLFSSGQHNVDLTVGSIADLNGLTYSRKQEREADRYANKVVFQLYGDNEGAVKFFKMLEEKEKAPEFLQYFSTHPSTVQRLKLIQQER